MLKKKVQYFFTDIPKQAYILEIGCGGGEIGNYLKNHGYKNYLGLDINPPADIVGDIKNWKNLGIKANLFDVIIAFEVVEHIDCFKECYELLKSGGQLMLTSPVPHMDWVMQILEFVGLNQERTSPHDHLVYFETIPYFSTKNIKIVGGLSQWGKFNK